MFFSSCQVDIAIQTPVSVNPRAQPAECYLIDALHLYVLGVSMNKTPLYKAVAKRCAMLINAGVIKRKKEAMGGRDRGLGMCSVSNII